MAYGAIARPGRSHSLQPRLYPLPAKVVSGGIADTVAPDVRYVLTLPFSADICPPAALAQAMRQCFNEELQAGRTYPQRGPMTEQEFSNYFLANDLIVGMVFSKTELQTDGKISLQTGPDSDGLVEALRGALISDDQRPANLLARLPTTGESVQLDVAEFLKRASSKSAVDWNARWRFAYYIKPNYPGRSSHLCNAGFLVPPSARGSGLGSLAGLTFVHYGPAAGYRGSIFNLVYVSNVASMRIWESLGFQQVGRIKEAGLLRTGPNGEEEYVDAWVVQGDFERLTRIQQEKAAARLHQAAEIEKSTV